MGVVVWRSTKSEAYSSYANSTRCTQLHFTHQPCSRQAREDKPHELDGLPKNDSLSVTVEGADAKQSPVLTVWTVSIEH